MPPTLDVDLVHRSVPSAVAGEVQDQAVDLAVGLAGAAADHLHVESGRQRRPQHGQQIDPRRVEAGRQHVDVDQAPDDAGLERGDAVRALGERRLAGHHPAGNAAGTERLADVMRVSDAAAEDQP